MTADAVFSRPIATAARLGDLAADSHRFIDKSVLVTGEPAALATINGRECLLSSVRLLIRMCRQVTVAVPADCPELEEECRLLVAKVNPAALVTRQDCAGPLNEFDAVLNVGIVARPDLPWTTINSSGWVARVSSGATSLDADCGRPNSIGSLAAACLGVADVFKRLVALKETRGKLLDGLSWSMFSCGPADGIFGPELPREIPADLVLVGAGAIGNGVLYLLSKLPLHGTARVVDPQRFGAENLGTCLLTELADIDAPKVALAERILRGPLVAQSYQEDMAAFGRRLGGEIPYPNIVLGSVDNIDARHAVQDLWPDLIIDGAIGDFGCQVSRHPWGEDSACLRCLFREPAGEAAELVASRATGLRPERVGHPDDAVSQSDVESAPDTHREWLKARLGHTVCSVVQEGVVSAISELPEKGFAPSVPFVACMSAAMIVSELVKHAAGWPTNLDTRFQMDLLRGPIAGQFVPQSRRSDCSCTTRAANIERWRQSR